MIKSFKHSGLQQFYITGSKAGIQPHHADKLRVQLSALNVAQSANDLVAPASWRLHKLSGNMADLWSITVNGNWRITFKFIDGDVELVDYLDYH